MSKRGPQSAFACTTRHVADCTKAWVTWTGYHHANLWINPTIISTLAQIIEFLQYSPKPTPTASSTIEIDDPYFYFTVDSLQIRGQAYDPHTWSNYTSQLLLDGEQFTVLFTYRLDRHKQCAIQ